MQSGSGLGQSEPPLPVAPSAEGPKQRRRNLRPALLTLVLAAVVLAGGAYWWLRAEPVLARYAPKDTQAYVEFPSVDKALIGLWRWDALEPGELDADKQKKRLIEALADSFDLGVGQVSALFDGVDAIALAARSDRDGEMALLLRLDSADLVRPILASDRFKKEDGLLGCERHRLRRRVIESPDVAAIVPPLEAALNEIGERKPKEGEDDAAISAFAVLFCEEERLLAVGHTRLLKDVARVKAGDQESLHSGNELFRNAEWPLGSSVLAFVDPRTMDNREIRESFLAGSVPVSAALGFVEEGIMGSLTFELRGDDVPPEALFTQSVELTLYEHLPSDTIGYLAFSTRFASSGRDVERALLDAAAGLDQRSLSQLQRALDQVVDKTDITLPTVIELTGQQGIVAVVGDDRSIQGLGGGEKEITLVAIVEVSDVRKAQRLIQDVRHFVEDRYDVSRRDGGFVAERKGDPHLSLTLEPTGHLLFAMGTESGVEDAIDVYRGKGRSLARDLAHRQALRRLPGRPQLLLWVDAGRMLDAALSRKSSGPRSEVREVDGDAPKPNRSVRDELAELELPVDALKLEGPRRPTAWVAAYLEPGKGSLRVELQSLNAVLLGAAWAAFEASPSALLSEIKTSETGSSECDSYVAMLRACAKTADASDKQLLEQILKSKLSELKSSSATKSEQADDCKRSEKSMKSLFDCK